jgi:hypothetical protein
MNITSKIAEEIGGELEKYILANAEIQFYANSATDEYQWKDSRFEETAGVFDNKSGNSRKEVITIFKKHIINKQNGLHKISTRIK